MLQLLVSDTEFLSTNYVMDYSLIVGVERSRRNLVVGVIDILR